jgi:hypothetical protein
VAQKQKEPLRSGIGPPLHIPRRRKFSAIEGIADKGADHVGASLVPRSLDAFAFIGRQLHPPKWIDDTALRFRATADENKKARGYPVTPFDPNRIHAE